MRQLNSSHFWKFIFFIRKRWGLTYGTINLSEMWEKKRLDHRKVSYGMHETTFRSTENGEKHLKGKKEREIYCQITAQRDPAYNKTDESIISKKKGLERFQSSIFYRTMSRASSLSWVFRKEHPLWGPWELQLCEHRKTLWELLVLWL